jgi:hypothetical protein
MAAAPRDLYPLMTLEYVVKALEQPTRL